MVRKKGPMVIVGKILIVMILVVEIYPIFWILMSSFKSTSEFTLSASYALPQGIHWQNYIDAWNRGRMSTYFVNSVIVTFVSLFFIMLLSSTSAFGLCKLKWKNRGRVLTLFLSGIFYSDRGCAHSAVYDLQLGGLYQFTVLFNIYICRFWSAFFHFPTAKLLNRIAG